MLADYLADFPGKFFHITLFAFFQEKIEKFSFVGQSTSLSTNQKNQAQGMPATGD